MPIGNLTSQILANVYLNESDRFIIHIIKPSAYMRYGDDFVVIAQDRDWLEEERTNIIDFIQKELKLVINSKNDIVVKTKQGIKFLGVEIFPNGRRLLSRNWQRAIRRVSLKNYASYYGLVRQHCSKKKKKYFDWRCSNLIEATNTLKRCRIRSQ